VGMHGSWVPFGSRVGWLLVVSLRTCALVGRVGLLMYCRFGFCLVSLGLHL